MGLITGLVSTVVHVAAGRNPYGHNHNKTNQPVVTTAASYTADRSSDANCGCSSGHNGQPCGICAVVLPFGKGRQQKRERRAMKHARKDALRAQRYAYRRYPEYAPGYMAVGADHHHHHHHHHHEQQWRTHHAGSSARQEGFAGDVERESGRRASTGDDMPPPAYEEREASQVPARRSVEVLRSEEVQRGQQKA
ncbi:uncharacterized protein CTRU02_209747 [Colletotrichum truncatum]|uniref:Uncharacterized protein n=1 Tax=Colletotrichum truncatum TaxID=5467 RepID=A0ACC3YTE2_COLTU|nr:uncharacterized protein CTRU02_02317 [Colletotrichum truncatum]KAF6798344.1 hypothetical protein CTRU02_02317 [Colletotrichum truncatum]